VNQNTDTDRRGPVFKPLSGKKILFGVTGGIACFKAAEYVRRLSREGAEVQTVLTKNASRFVTEITFSALSGQKAQSHLFDIDQCHEIPHISLAKKAELLVVLPATADIIAKFAHGLADDLLSTLLLSFKGPVVIFPSMNPDMYGNQATQANLELLKERGVTIVEPDTGIVVCGARGKGRLPHWDKILHHIKKALWPKTLGKKNILITAGPTREHLDPVRFISNRSSGKMGFRLAEAASLRDANTNLVSGPVSLRDPIDVMVKKVETAREMAEAVFSLAPEMDVIIMAAAVSDYTPLTVHPHKLKKTGKELDVRLTPTTDILMELGKKKGSNQILVGFCAESQDLVENAFAKLRKKNLDLIIANDITQPGAGFDVDTNRVLMIDQEENVEELPMMDKAEVSERILDKIEEIIAAREL